MAVRSKRVETIGRVRAFNRFYTRQIGLLNEKLAGSDFRLAEARILYEIAHHPGLTAARLAQDLLLDRGYLSRVLASLQRRRLITRRRSPHDGRQRLITMTARGKTAFGRLDERTRTQISAMLAPLDEARQARLVAAMGEIEGLLVPAEAESELKADPKTHRDADRTTDRNADPAVTLRPPAAPHPAVTLRAPRPGDIGWCIHRHGVLYAREYGWDATFEALVATILGRFVERFDAARERGWIAEVAGRFAGCVFLVNGGRRAARLRCLLVEPDARGLGIGSRLVGECIEFARAAGYRRLTLWTNDVLHAARRIYERAGFHLVKEERGRLFGHDVCSQTWDLDLADVSGPVARVARPSRP